MTLLTGKHRSEAIRNVLVVIDPRRPGHDTQPAFDRAVEVAARTKSKLHLVTCDYVEGLSRAVFADEAQVGEARENYLSGQRKLLEKLVETAKRAGIDADSEAVWYRPQHEGILDAASRFGAQLIIKAASDYSLAERMLLGTTDWELVRRAPQLVWLVKSTAPVVSTNWIVAVDPSHPDEKHLGLDRKLMSTGRSLAQSARATLYAFHAFAPPVIVAPTGGTGAAAPALGTIPADSDAMLEERRRHVRGLLDDFDIPESRTDICVGDTVSQLDRVVKHRHAAVVIAGAVSRGLLARFLVGNTAESMLNRVECDVLVVKPDDFGD